MTKIERYQSLIKLLYNFNKDTTEHLRHEMDSVTIRLLRETLYASDRAFNYVLQQFINDCWDGDNNDQSI